MIRALVVMAACCGLLCAADRELIGQVVDDNSGAPIARAHVTVHFYQGSSTGAEIALLSEADGSFRITNLPDSPYQITCEKAGYLNANQGMAPRNQADAKTAPVILRLIAQAVLEATVVDDKDVPVQYAFLQLLRQQVINGRKQFLVNGGGATDETGHVRIFGLTSGRYYIGIGVQRMNGPRAKTTAYPPLYYPNATEIEAAQALDLKAGDEQQIHIRLPELVPAHEIRGVVVSATDNVGLQLIRQPSDRVPLPGNVQSNWDPKTRTFHISHVVPGIYQLTASAQKGNERQQATRMVTVGDQDVTGLRLELTDDPGISGTVRIEGTGLPLKNSYVTIQSARSNNGAQTDADGNFRVAYVQPDTYRVMVPNIGGTQCLKSIQQNGRDVRDGLVLAAESAPAPLDIVISDHCGSIDGSLPATDGITPGTILGVMLLRKSGDEFVLEKQTYLSQNANNTAPQFRFQALTPGDYFLYVWPQTAEVEYSNTEWMRPFESYGMPVTVTDGGELAVTLEKVLIPPVR